MDGTERIMIDTKLGAMQILTEQVEWGDVQELVAELRAETPDAEIDARHIGWAGPYEVLLSITAIAQTAGSLAQGAGAVLTGIAAALALYAERHPEKSLEMRMPDGTELKITGDLDPERAALINRVFEQNSGDLDDERYRAGIFIAPM